MDRILFFLFCAMVSTQGVCAPPVDTPFPIGDPLSIDSISDFDEEQILYSDLSPALVIDTVQFANVDKKGRIIDDYGEHMRGRWVKYLAQRISYRTLVPDTLIVLDVKFFNPQGNLMRDADSSAGCSYRTTFRTGNTNENHLQYLGKLKAKFGKGCRMEIYDGAVCLLSTRVPMQGVITYVPIMMQTARVLSDKYREYLNMSLAKRAALFQQLHIRKYTGPFMDNYVITGWKAVEK